MNSDIEPRRLVMASEGTTTTMQLSNGDRLQQQHAAIANVLSQFGHMLDQADQALVDLEQQDRLGLAIRRGCVDLAEAIGNVAEQLEHHAGSEEQELAKACLSDAADLRLRVEQQQRLTEGSYAATTTSASNNTSTLVSPNSMASWESLPSAQLEDMARMTPNDMQQVIGVAGTLLRDVEATLRSIEQSEANELADVAITLARLFIASVQSVHESLGVSNIDEWNGNNARGGTVHIEMLDDEDATDEEDFSDYDYSAADTPKKNNTTQSPSLRKNNPKGVRVLWPPLGPAVASACQWGHDAAQQKPLIAVALGLTLWPAALVTTVLGTPLLVADHVMQTLYSNFQDTPVLQGMERSAAQLYHTGRLSLLCTKLTARQTLRLAQRQLDRHGGPGPMARHIADWSLERVTHPIDTLGMAWNSLAWGVGAVQDALAHFTDQEREEQVQDLQQ